MSAFTGAEWRRSQPWDGTDEDHPQTSRLAVLHPLDATSDVLRDVGVEWHEVIAVRDYENDELVAVSLTFASARQQAEALGYRVLTEAEVYEQDENGNWDERDDVTWPA